VSENAAGIGTVTRQMVQQRASELAVIDGRPAHEASPADWAQAKQELTGDSASTVEEEAVEEAPESERWDPLPGSTGHKASVAPSADEDDDGRSDNERLVDEGIAGAEYDHMRQASKPEPK